MNERLKTDIFFGSRHKTIKSKFFSTLIIATKLIIGLNIITPKSVLGFMLYTNMKYAYNRNVESIEYSKM